MIQDISPHVLDNRFTDDITPQDEDIVLHFAEDGVLSRDGLFPKVRDFSRLNKESLIYVFSIDEEHCFVLEEDGDRRGDLPEGYVYASLRSIMRKGNMEKFRAFTAFTGLQLFNWYRNNRFCGRCGKRTTRDASERAIRCSCGNAVYPHIQPAVIVGVRNGDRLLVTKYRDGYKYYALIAGFTEIGETLEDTVRREVMEEAGLKVKNITYYKSQPWGIVDDLLAGFYCDVDGSDEITMDEKELKVAEWRSREEIELQPDDISLTNEMMYMFQQGKDRA